MYFDPNIPDVQFIPLGQARCKRVEQAIPLLAAITYLPRANQNLHGMSPVPKKGWSPNRNILVLSPY